MIKKSAFSKMVGCYLLQKKIGQGAFSEVFSGVDVQNARRVAVKVIPSTLVENNPKIKTGLQNQLKAMNLVEDFQHIVKFYDFLKTTNNYYFIYQLCQGNLKQLMKKQIFPQKRAIQYFRQILKGFQELISHNIIQRDVKPENILIKNQKLKIADFGLCKILKQNVDIMASVVGTFNYQSPQITYGNLYTTKCDIYSLGIIFYQMMYGKRPFGGETLTQKLQQLHQSQIIFPENVSVSKQTKIMLKRMLQKYQQKRINWFQLFEYYFPTKSLNTQQLTTIQENNFLKVQKNKQGCDNLLKNQSKISTQATETLTVNHEVESKNLQQGELTVMQIQISIESLMKMHEQILKLTQICLQLIKMPENIYPKQIVALCLNKATQKLRLVIKKIQFEKDYEQLKILLEENLQFLQENFSQLNKIHFINQEEKQQANSYLQEFIMKVLKYQDTKKLKQCLILCGRLFDVISRGKILSENQYNRMSQEELIEKLKSLNFNLYF